MHRLLGEVEADNLDFATHNYTPRGPHQGDFCEESFFLRQDPQSGQYVLMRRRNPRLAPDPLAGGSREEIARGLLGLRFEYSDGLDWYENWGEVDRRSQARSSKRERSNLDGLPEAVRITLWFDANPRPKPKTVTEPLTAKAAAEPPLVFQTVARLNLAALSQPNSADSAANLSGPDASGQTTPNGANPRANP